MINTETITEYLKTIIITVFVVLLLATAFVFFMGEHIVSEKSRLSPQQDVLQEYMVGVLIEKNKYLSEKFPNNYLYNLKLATLYDGQKDYKNAELEYDNAVKKTPFGQYKTIYKQACFYVQRKNYTKAQEIMNSMGEMPNDQLIEYKGDFYKLLGDKLMSEGYYALGIIKYERALFYQTKIKIPFKKLILTKTTLINAYLTLADKYIEVNDPENAIKVLTKAYDLIPSNLVKYKLAVLTMDNDPKKAVDFFADVIEEDPLLVDFKLYYDLLNKIAYDEYNNGDETLAKLYRVKALNLEKYAIRNIIYPNDITVETIHLNITPDKKHKRNNLQLNLKLKNESPFSILNLTVETIIKDGDKIIDCSVNNIFNKENIFPSKEITPYLIVNTNQPYKKQNFASDSITVEIYAYKTLKFKQLITTYTMKKPKGFTQTRQKNYLQIFLEILPFSFH